MRPEKYQTLQMAEFALSVSYEDIGDENIQQLKRHLLDALGSMIFSSKTNPIKKLVGQLKLLGEGGKCNVPLLGSLAFDRAAQLYTALIRYLDFMDNFMGKEATCHPSDNIGALFAASHFKTTSGKDFLTAMAVSYQMECRLIEELPVMKKGLDHTVLLAYSIIAGISRLYGLTKHQAAHALGMAGCSINSLVTSRASYTYEWKGFASSLDALDCTNIALLALHGMTGPIEIFEGPKGIADVFDMSLKYDWQHENFELIKKCVLKKYNAEVHAQSAIDAAIQLRHEHDIVCEDIDKIDVTIFLTAYHIIGGGAYGNRKEVNSKEQADHSLFYLIAVALLDEEVTPNQFSDERINRNDVQQLLKKIHIDTGIPFHKPVEVAGLLDPYTIAYPEKMKVKISIRLTDGTQFNCEKDSYHGFFKNPFTMQDCISKFIKLSTGIIDQAAQSKIIDTVNNLEKSADMQDLLLLLALNLNNNGEE